MVAMLALRFFGLISTLALGAPPLTLPSLTLINLSYANATFSRPFPQPHSSNYLPPSPYYYTSPSTSVIIKFYSYGVPLPHHAVLTVLNTALRDVNAQLYPQTIIKDPFLHYSSGKVYLVMQGNGRMTWEVFETTIWALFYFLETYECVDFDFDVGEFGMERVFGTGVLGKVG